MRKKLQASILWLYTLTLVMPRCAPAQIRTNVDMVLVPVDVTDRRGTPIAGLTADQFVVLEDNVPRPIMAFSAQDEPCSIGIVLDVSGSMKADLPAAKAIVQQVLGRIDDRDETFLFAVSSSPEALSAFTGDASRVGAQVETVRAGGRTALTDTVMLALERMHQAQRSRRALIVVSDGADNHSRAVRSEVLRAAAESYAQIYTVAFTAPTGYRKPIQLAGPETGDHLLSELSGRSGGLHFAIDKSANAASIADKIARAIRNQYLIGYSPAGGAPGKWRRIRVKLALDDVRVNARAGYYGR